ncbi:MAG: transglycosylase SLT domain-containing protein [Patescibacteria group bacterium]|jgi:hypothetical protein
MNYKKTIYTKFTYKLIAIIAVIAFSFNMMFPQVATAETRKNIIDEETCPVNQETTTSLTEIEDSVDSITEMKKWVLNKVAEAGLDTKIAETIINCESRWNPDAMGVNANKTVDLGLWQINSIHKDISNADKLDYKKATEWAINKRMKDGNWNAWYCARRLVYKNY